MKQPCFRVGHRRPVKWEEISTHFSRLLSFVVFELKALFVFFFVLFVFKEEPTAIENVRELLGQARREFYIDIAAKAIYYAADFEQDMQSAQVIAPVSFVRCCYSSTVVALSNSLSRDQVLVNSTGLANVIFKDLVFEYAGWTQPSGPNGYIDLQAGVMLVEHGDRLDRVVR